MPYICAKAAGKNDDRCLRLTGSQVRFYQLQRKTWLQDGADKYYSGCSLRPLAANGQRFVLRFPNSQNKPTPFGYNDRLVISGTSPVNTPPDNAWSLNLLFETYQLLFHLAVKEDFKTIVFNNNMVPWGGSYTWGQGASQPSPLTPEQAFQIELVNPPPFRL